MENGKMCAILHGSYVHINSLLRFFRWSCNFWINPTSVYRRRLKESNFHFVLQRHLSFSSCCCYYNNCGWKCISGKWKHLNKGRNPWAATCQPNSCNGFTVNWQTANTHLSSVTATADGFREGVRRLALNWHPLVVKAKQIFFPQCSLSV